MMDINLPNPDGNGVMNVGGILAKNLKQQRKLNPYEISADVDAESGAIYSIVNILFLGKMIEGLEQSLLKQIYSHCLGKVHEVLDRLRPCKFPLTDEDMSDIHEELKQTATVKTPPPPVYE
eukprot:GHVO01050965.1.p2 GENE.GHVO01050965.1~~GHVO01050965.1.p2  ORF type:complete len:121 (+),score=22.26 GHVO01050965.1:477-839(+)